jgi:uracil-DNA glycosylase family 4
MTHLNEKIIGCSSCLRLVEWRQHIATIKRKSFMNDTYWARPVHGFGDPTAKIMIVGLAPAAHGANRTGRIFTGDRSGEWLYTALFENGLSNQPQSINATDSLELREVFITSVVKCAPPQNKPEKSEIQECRKFFVQEHNVLKDNLKVIVCLGQLAHKSVFNLLNISPTPKFAHASEFIFKTISVIDSYHPSQQNTFTNRLTKPMFDQVFKRAKILANLNF